MNRKTSVLVVDDDVNICELIRLYLEKKAMKYWPCIMGKARWMSLPTLLQTW